MQWDYSALLGPPSGAMECSVHPQGDARPSVDTPLPCSERHLQILWLEQKTFLPLLSATKQPIEVIHPGNWNHGPGPDFLQAHLRIGGIDYHGAVEIHLVDRGWVQHGHAIDPRYEEVILHISLEPPQIEHNLFTQSGRCIERAYLGSFLRAPLQTLLQAIDLDLYPSPSCTQPGFCAAGLFDTLDSADTRSFFHSAALWRLRQKRAFLASWTPDIAMQCAIGIALGLGYKHNARALARLFLYLRPYRHLQHEPLLAYALGLCGFFNDHYRLLWKDSTYYGALHQHWQTHTLSLPKSEQFSLVTAQQRPTHHPVRCLTAIVCMLHDPHLLGLWDQFQERWQALYRRYSPHNPQKPHNTRELARIKKALIDCVPSYEQHPYWSKHYTFEKEGHAPNLDLIGEERREIILINAFFPLLRDTILLRGDSVEQDFFLYLYASWKSHTNSKQRYITHRFFSHAAARVAPGAQGAQVVHSSTTTLHSSTTTPFTEVMMEQGAFQLHSDFCIHYEASCVGCPFVARAKGQVNAFCVRK